MGEGGALPAAAVLNQTDLCFKGSSWAIRDGFKPFRSSV